jgi:hypothetical protein
MKYNDEKYFIRHDIQNLIYLWLTTKMRSLSYNKTLKKVSTTRELKGKSCRILVKK